MIKTTVYCDLCCKEIHIGYDKYSQYKVKQCITPWGKFPEKWDSLMVHTKCWKKLCAYLLTMGELE